MSAEARRAQAEGPTGTKLKRAVLPLNDHGGNGAHSDASNAHLAAYKAEALPIKLHGHGAGRGLELATSSLRAGALPDELDQLEN